MPEVVDCAGPQFQSTHAEIFGVEIPIAACMADQVNILDSQLVAYLTSKSNDQIYAAFPLIPF